MEKLEFLTGKVELDYPTLSIKFKLAHSSTFKVAVLPGYCFIFCISFGQSFLKICNRATTYLYDLARLLKYECLQKLSLALETERMRNKAVENALKEEKDIVILSFILFLKNFFQIPGPHL